MKDQFARITSLNQQSGTRSLNAALDERLLDGGAGAASFPRRAGPFVIDDAEGVELSKRTVNSARSNVKEQ
jgi:hypothetical protein